MHTDIVDAYRTVRRFTRTLTEPLSPEDQGIQSMPDVSPTKWHFAHTTWFYETFVLSRFDASFRPFDPHYAVLFNSYYNGVGAQHPRAARGLLSRPGLHEVHAYRDHVDARMSAFLSHSPPREAIALTTLGLNHEQQHQELILTDAKHVLWSNPLRPVYRASTPNGSAPAPAAALGWQRFDEGMVSIGHDGDGFAFDNERPRHRVFLEAFEIATRPVSNAEYAAFIDDGGYERPDLWLSDGWAVRKAEGWTAPLYWEEKDGGWVEFSFAGMHPVEPNAPVAHVSYYEADAYARWRGERIPTEAEWERAVSGASTTHGNFVESGRLAAAPLADRSPGVAQLFGDVWEWTASPYVGYPRYRPPAGVLAEYNGKFMCNQLVLRGGSCLSPRSHIRATYRNFFPPGTRWQMSGIRLARWP